MEWRCPRSGRRSVARFVGHKIHHHLNEIFQTLRHWHCNHLYKRLGHSWSRPNHLSALFQNLRTWRSCGALPTSTISSKICGIGLVVGANTTSTGSLRLSSAGTCSSVGCCTQRSSCTERAHQLFAPHTSSHRQASKPKVSSLQAV